MKPGWDHSGILKAPSKFLPKCFPVLDAFGKNQFCGMANSRWKHYEILQEIPEGIHGNAHN